jgi:hypothetical protein
MTGSTNNTTLFMVILLENIRRFAAETYKLSATRRLVHEPPAANFDCRRYQDRFRRAFPAFRFDTACHPPGGR